MLLFVFYLFILITSCEKSLMIFRATVYHYHWFFWIDNNMYTKRLKVETRTRNPASSCLSWWAKHPEWSYNSPNKCNRISSRRQVLRCDLVKSSQYPHKWIQPTTFNLRQTGSDRLNSDHVLPRSSVFGVVMFRGALPWISISGSLADTHLYPIHQSTTLHNYGSSYFNS